jgi:hypothetical protein
MPRKNVVKLPPKEPLLNKTQKIVATIISCLILAGMLWSGITKADSRYPKDVHVKEAFQVQTATNVYLDAKISVLELKEKRSDIQSRLWALEKEFKGMRMPESVVSQKVALEKDLKDIDEAIAYYRAEASRKRREQEGDSSFALEKAPSPKVQSTNPYLQKGF